MNEEEELYVDEKGELWRFYGIATNGTNWYEPIKITGDASRDSTTDISKMRKVRLS